MRRTVVDREGPPALLVLQRGGDDGLLAVANLTAETVSIAAMELSGRKVLLSTEDARYGGGRNSLPSPFGRGAGGEGMGSEDCGHPPGLPASRPHPNPLPKGEGTYQQMLAHEVLVFDGGGGWS